MSTAAWMPARARRRLSWPVPLRRLGQAAASVAPVLPVVVARVAVASGVAVLAGLGWGLVVAGLLVATWPRRAGR